jgi:hypothetical protein
MSAHGFANFNPGPSPGHPAAQPAPGKRKSKSAAAAQPLPSGWRQYLQRQDGEPVCNLANALTAFRSAPELAGIAAYDLMGHQTLVTHRLASSRMRIPNNRPLQDTDVSEFQEWIQRHGEMRRMARETVQQAVDMVAREHAFHPVVDYLNGLKWDGVKRLGKPWQLPGDVTEVSWLTSYSAPTSNRLNTSPLSDAGF